MSPDEAMNYLSTVGFPIVACYFMWKFINGTLAELSKMLRDNTLAITRLCEKLGGEEDEETEKAD
jgi:hypothetical protein